MFTVRTLFADPPPPKFERKVSFKEKEKKMGNRKHRQLYHFKTIFTKFCMVIHMDVVKEKLDKKVKKREEMEEKRRKYILTQRKVEIEANNQRFLRDPIITLHHGYKTLHKGERFYQALYTSSINIHIQRIPSRRKTLYQLLLALITRIEVESAIKTLTIWRAAGEDWISSTTMAAQLTQLFTNYHTKRDLKLPNLVANSEKSGDKEINENEIINLLSPVMENEVAPGDCKHTIIATPTVYSSLTSKGNIMQSYQDVNINEIHEEIPFTKYRISTPDIAARCSNWVTELDRLSRTENRHRNKSIHFVLPAVVKDHQQFPKKEKKRHRDHKVLSIKGGPEHFKTQMMVLEEVRRVLEMEKKTNMSSVQRHTQTSNELDLDYNCSSLSSEDSVEITLKSTPTDDIPAVDTFTLNSGLGRRVEDNGDFSVGSGFRRYGDAVVVLSPVTRLEKNDILTENSVTSSGVGESCTEDVVNRNSPQYLKRRARVSNNRLHTQKELQCMCYNFEKETNVISKEEELLECLKRLETRLQEQTMRRAKRAVKLDILSQTIDRYNQSICLYNENNSFLEEVVKWKEASTTFMISSFITMYETNASSAALLTPLTIWKCYPASYESNKRIIWHLQLIIISQNARCLAFDHSLMKKWKETSTSFWITSSSCQFSKCDWATLDRPSQEFFPRSSIS
ncbi:hypothetical protein GQR58_026236 [Nymphon striatum]|nr:hypothetical protein GQR58_026236 [Nymphon striatum]